MAYDYSAGGFERFYNSTFGVPQQLMMRMLRVMQDPKVDLFDEEGLMDASLIPVLGLFDDERKDVSVEEMTKRVNKLTGAKLDKKSMGSQLAVGILTDPTTYMTGGLSAIGKAGNAAQKALRVGDMPKLLSSAGLSAGKVAKGEQKLPTSSFLKYLDDAMKDTSITSKEHRVLQKARNHVGGMSDEYADIGSLLTKSSETELRLGLPVLHRWGAGIKVTDEHKYWFQFMGSSLAKSGGGKAVGAITRPLAHIPFVGAGLKGIANNASGLGTGLKVGRENLSTTLSTSKFTDKELDSAVASLSVTGKILYTNTRGIHYKKVAKRVKDEIKAGTEKFKDKLTPEQIQKRATLIALGPKKGRVPSDPNAIEEAYQRIVGTMLNLPENVPAPLMNTPMLRKGLNNFRATFGKNERRFMSSFEDITVPTDRKKAVQKFMKKGKMGFDAGVSIAKFWGKIFKHGGDYSVLDKSNQALAKYNSLATEQVAQVARDGAYLLRQDAKALGMKPEELDSLILHIAEGQPMMEEIGAFINNINKGLDAGEDLGGAKRAVGNFMVRLLGLMDSTGVQARGGKSTPQWKKIVRYMQDAFGDGVRNPTSVTFESAFDTLPNTAAIAARELLTGDAANKTAIGWGRHKGKFLGTLDDTQLDEVMADLKVGKTRPTKADTYQFVQDDPLMSNVMKTLNITPKELLRLLDHDAIKNFKGNLGTNPQALVMPEIGNFSPTTGKRVVPSVNSGGKRKKINAQQFYALRKLREEVDQGIRQLSPDDAFTVERLNTNQQILYGKLDKIKRLRADGDELVQELPEAIPEMPLPGRTATGVSATLDGEEVVLNSFGRAVGRLSAVHAEMARALNAGVGVSPTLAKELQGALNHISGVWDDGVRSVLGKNTNFMDYMRDIQRSSLVEAVRAGSHTINSPVAYVSRIFTRNSMRLLRGALGSKGFEDIAKAHLPTLGSSFARDADQMDIESLNALYQSIKKGTIAESESTRAFTKVLEDVAEVEGIDLSEKFTESMWHATIARKSQAVTGASNRNYVAAALDSVAETQVGVAGKVVGYMTNTSDEILGEIPTGPKHAVDPLSTTSTVGSKDVARSDMAIVIRAEDGTNHIVPIGMMNGDTHIGYAYGSRFDNVTDAISARATRGNMTDAEVFSNASLSPAAGKVNDYSKIAELKGQQVFIGEKAAVEGIQNAVSSMWKGSNEVAVAYDTAQYFVKKWQTVFRPAFHVSNFMSMFSQMATVGTRPVHQIGGLADALHFLGTNSKATAAYSRFNVHASASGKISGFVAENTKGGGTNFLNVVRKAGIDEILELSPEEIAKKFPHLKQDDMFFKVGTQKYSMYELLEAWREGNMFSTFATEGLRGGSGVSETALKLRALADEEGVSRVYSKFQRGRDTAMESSEVTVRLAAFFGQLRGGKTLSEAVENVKMATVDYASLTLPERTYMKRAFAYYTFPRKFLPVAGKYFAEHPVRMATSAKLISQEGLFREQRGRLRFDINEDIGSMDATRVMPHLEALKTLETVGEVFLKAGAIGEGLPFNSFGDQAAATLRNEELHQKTPEVLTFGSIPTAGFAALDGREDTSAMDELVDAFWMSRFIFDSDDPMQEESNLSKAMKVIVPVSERDQEAEKEMLKRRFRKMKTTIQSKYQASIRDGQNDDAEMYLEELQRLNEDFIDDLPKIYREGGGAKIAKELGL